MGTCTVHYIREVSLQKIVFKAVKELADFVGNYEKVFLYMLAKKDSAMRQTEQKRMKQTVENGERRIKELDHLIEKIYEDNALGKLPNERFQRMMQNFEKEQKELIQSVTEAKEVLEPAEQRTVDLRLLLRALREITDLKELTPTIVNSLIRRIEVHNNDKSSGHCHVQVDIYFTAIGLFDIPIENEMLAMMEEIRKNPQQFRFVA